MRIIAPTDFSPAADRATRRAASLASELGAALRLVHVLPPRAYLEQLFPPEQRSEIDAFRERAERALQERAKTSSATLGSLPECEIHYGSAHQAILDTVESAGASLVILGALGEHEGALRSEGAGETALKVVERCRVPTLLVRRELFAHYSHVLGCVRGEPADRVIFDWANRMSPADLIHVVSAYSVPYERRLTEWGASSATIDVYATRERDMRSQHVIDLMKQIDVHPARVRMHIERGDPLEIILQTAARYEADLLIAGRRARRGAMDAGPFGSVARQVAMRAPIDVLIVPPPETPVPL
jgi:nucleotide-binding universal stress UspA family protein